MRPRVGISACLLGEAVRYDGGHKRSAVLAGELARVFDWVAVCPEVGAGMGVPRAPLHLVGGRLVTHAGTRDFTDDMTAFATRELDRLAALGVFGFVFKERSPSCDVRDGMFARAFAARFPALAVTGDESLADPTHRRAFVDAVMASAGRAGML
jgi:uncharacterized protein YbbK (DUF523 family)